MEMMILTVLIGITNLCVGYALAIWMGMGPVSAADLEAEFGACSPAIPSPPAEPKDPPAEPVAAESAEPEEAVVAAAPADPPPAEETVTLPGSDEDVQPVATGDSDAIEAALAGLVQELVSSPLDEIAPEQPATAEADSVSPALEKTAPTSAP